RSAPRPASRKAAHNPPQPASHSPPAPVQRKRGESLLGSIGSTIAEGFSFGAGNAMAHRAVEAVFGPRTVQHETVPPQAPAALQANTPAMANLSGGDSCGNHSKAFQDCLNNYESDISKCQFYLNMLNECRRSPSMP
ncbi:hypothetical protein KI387_008362, partial [Taxus chinensis]